MPTRSRSLTLNGPGAGPASPDQPIHTPRDSRMTGSSALTSPPGLGRHSASPSGPSLRSTGSRLATTTNRCPPSAQGGGEDGSPAASAVSIRGITQPYARASGRRQFPQVLREHLPPRGPLVRPLRPPVVHPVRDPLGPQDLGHPPGFADVLPLALAGREDDPA